MHAACHIQIIALDLIIIKIFIDRYKPVRVTHNHALHTYHIIKAFVTNCHILLSRCEIKTVFVFLFLFIYLLFLRRNVTLIFCFGLYLI